MASQYFTGTLIPSSIVRGSSGDTYGTHHSVLGVGGYMEVKTIAQRNAIPISPIVPIGELYHDGISSGQRRLGMVVYVAEDNNAYQLNVNYDVWTGSTDSQKVIALGNNNNWVKIFNTTTGEQISKSFYQSGHTFTHGNILAHNTTVFIKSTATNAATYEPLGIVSKVVDVNNFILTFSGYISTSGITDSSGNTISGGTLYYVSDVSGKISNIPTSTLGKMVKPILAGIGNNTGIVLQYNGKLNGADGVSISDFNNYTGATQTFLDEVIVDAENLGEFIGTIAIQKLTINAFGSTNDGVYESLYNNYYRDDAGVIRIGIPIGELPRRAYVRNTLPAKSWVWNTFTGSTNQIGWILVNGNAQTSVGLPITGITYSGTPYDESIWIESTYYNNGGNLTLEVVGNLTSGDTYTNNGPIYAYKLNNELKLRTIESLNTDTLVITHDDDFIYLNANPTSGTVTGATNGLTKIGENVSLGGTLIGSGTTIITDPYKVGIQYSEAYGDNFLPQSLVDKEYVDTRSNNKNISNVTGSTYFALSTDNAIGGRSSPSGCTIFLPAVPAGGHELIIFDKDGLAGTTVNTHINVNGNGKLILDWNSATINTDYGSITFLYNGIFWSVVGFTSAPSYSL